MMKTIKGIISLAIAGLVGYLSKLTVPIMVLVFFMAVDYITGITSAWISGNLSSRTGIIGIIKKVCYLVTICVAMGADYLICTALCEIGIEYNLSYLIGMTVTIWLILNELISILENTAKITGKNAPDILLKLLDKLKNTVEKSDNNA